jgi:hypothetical protein
MNVNSLELHILLSPVSWPKLYIVHSFKGLGHAWHIRFLQILLNPSLCSNGFYLSSLLLDQKQVCFASNLVRRGSEWSGRK